MYQSQSNVLSVLSKTKLTTIYEESCEESSKESYYIKT